MGWHVGSRSHTPSGSVGGPNLPGPAGPSCVRRRDDRFHPRGVRRRRRWEAMGPAGVESLVQPVGIVVVRLLDSADLAEHLSDAATGLR
jgi:hypothetical protein